MTKEQLLNSAASLNVTSETASTTFSTRKEELSNRVISLLRERKDLDKLIGTFNLTMMSDNAHNMSRFMESMFLRFEPKIFVETIMWVFRAYRAHGFQLTFWSAHLNTWIHVLKEDLHPSIADELIPYYTWIQVNIPHFAHLTDNNSENQPE